MHNAILRNYLNDNFFIIIASNNNNDNDNNMPYCFISLKCFLFKNIDDLFLPWRCVCTQHFGAECTIRMVWGAAFD